MPPQKRACFTVPASRFEVGESSTAATTRQIGHTLVHRDAHELYVRDGDAQDDRALLREAVYARQAWSRSKDRSLALEALIRAQVARTTALEA
ncbi:hypothetical protein Tco_1199868 [Tanacetum coccineum]